MRNWILVAKLCKAAVLLSVVATKEVKKEVAKRQAKAKKSGHQPKDMGAAKKPKKE